MSDFTFKTDLIISNTPNKLTPLGIQNHNAKTSTPTNQKVWFDIKIEGDKIDLLTVKINNSNQVLFQGELEKYMLVPGQYQWGWDGFNALGVFERRIQLPSIWRYRFDEVLSG